VFSVPPFFAVSAIEKLGISPATAEAASKARRDTAWR
jgi:hypothetical protein